MELARELGELLLAAVERAQPPQPNEKPWMTTAQAAEYAGVKAETIRHWVRRGYIRAGRAGRDLRLRASDIDAHVLAEGSGNPATAPADGIHPRVLEILGEAEEAG